MNRHKHTSLLISRYKIAKILIAFVDFPPEQILPRYYITCPITPRTLVDKTARLCIGRYTRLLRGVKVSRLVSARQRAFRN